MPSSVVFKNAYEGYLNGYRGNTKQAIKSLTKMYQEGLHNPTQAKYEMSKAQDIASKHYDKTTKDNPIKTGINFTKMFVKMLIDKKFNKAENAFNEAYQKLYPRTSFIREVILEEQKMP